MILMNPDEKIRLQFTGSPADNDTLLTREWLVTNGLGGYASGTLANIATRRFHSLLTANLTRPSGRHVMLNKLTEFVRNSSGESWRLGGKELVKEGPELEGLKYIKEFRLESGIPVWRYQLGDIVLEKWILMPHQQNTVHIGYRLVEGQGPVRLRLRLGMHMRLHGSSLKADFPKNGYALNVFEGHYEIKSQNLPPLRLLICGARGAFVVENKIFDDLRYRMEEALGYEAVGDLWCPGYFRVDLSSRAVALIASTEDWETILAIDPSTAFDIELDRQQRLVELADPVLRQGGVAQLVVAADQFIVRPLDRVIQVTRAKAAGDEIRSIIAGYHWFTDWGRDTMISLEGLTLVTGRQGDAAHILLTFADYVRDGLIPNNFPEGQDEGVYYTADATFWFFHALDRYAQLTGDRVTLRRFIPLLHDIIEKHLAGTRFGIGVDPADGLLRQGDSRFPLTWMDAKMDGWVVTPRRGKAVEINALWYNALCLLQRWYQEEGQAGPAGEMAKHAARARESFNMRFWNEKTGYLFDVVDGEHGDDPACRPNQIFAVSLPNPILDEARWRPVVDLVREKLLTPMGLRTLSADHPDYKANYRGDLRNRDAAYHQGTVWPWLLGPFIDAWLKAYPEDQPQARNFLKDFAGKQLIEGCIGSIHEIFDAEQPFAPRGCISQAWSVAEILRCWVKTAENNEGELK
jgi:predicted glycogen debranching enzyme